MAETSAKPRLRVTYHENPQIITLYLHFARLFTSCTLLAQHRPVNPHVGFLFFPGQAHTADLPPTRYLKIHSTESTPSCNPRTPIKSYNNSANGGWGGGGRLECPSWIRKNFPPVWECFTLSTLFNLTNKRKDFPVGTFPSCLPSRLPSCLIISMLCKFLGSYNREFAQGDLGGRKTGYFLLT